MSSKAKIISDFVICKLLGSGNYSHVYGGYHKITEQRVAVKHIKKTSIKPKVSEKLMVEIEVLKYIHHPNIIHLIDVVVSERSIYIVLEFCRGGELAKFLKKTGKLSEKIAQRFAIQLRNGLYIFNELGIVHRDLKPQNILMSESSESAILKIADFGFAKFSFDSSMNKTVCGSPLYMAPEILKGKEYNRVVDLWSFGVILWQLLFGQTPFAADNWAELIVKIEQTKLCLPPDSFVSDECIDLLFRLLEKEPENRIKFDDFYNHEFFHVSSTELSPLSTPKNGTLTDSTLSFGGGAQPEEWIMVSKTAESYDKRNSLLSDIKLGGSVKIERRLSIPESYKATMNRSSLEVNPLYKQAEESMRKGTEHELANDTTTASQHYKDSIDLFQQLFATDLNNDDSMRVDLKISCLKERVNFTDNTNEEHLYYHFCFNNFIDDWILQIRFAKRTQKQHGIWFLYRFNNGKSCVSYQEYYHY